MNVELSPAPWTKMVRTPELDEAVDVLGDGVWREAAIEFHAERAAKVKRGKRAPKGIQPFINDVVDERFETAGWFGERGRFRKGDTWIRVTFRHQMSLGTDYLDALRLHKTEGVEMSCILAASRGFLNLITPNDASALVSYEKLKVRCMELDGAFTAPLLLGKLKPKSPLPQDVAEGITEDRPRDVTIPRE